MKRIFYLITLLARIGAVANAQEAMPLSLKDAMDLAVKNNNTAKNARLDILNQKAKNAEITGVAYPQINGRAEYDYYFALPKTYIDGKSFPGADPNGPDTTIELIFGQKHTTVAGITASQMIFNGSLFVALKAREELMNLSKQNAQLTEEGIRYNVQRAYYGLVVAKRQFHILSNSLANARAAMNDVSEMYKAGFVEKLDIDRSTVQVNNLATDSLRTANILAVTEQLMKYQMGMNIDQPIVLTDTSLEASLSAVNSVADNNFSYDRTDFNLLNTQLRLNQYDLKRRKNEGLPTLNGLFSLGYNYAANDFGKLFDRFPYSSYAGIQLNVPIFDGLQRRNRVKQAKIAIDKTKNSITDLQIYIDYQIAQSKSTLRNSMLAMENQNRNLTLANTVLDLSRKKYKAGVGSNLEVNQAQIELLQAQNNYFQSMLDVFNAQSDLQRALGDFK